MIISKTMYEELKKTVLERLGNPDKFYQVWFNEEGYYVEEQTIESIDLDARLSGGYTLKINNTYVSDTGFLFSKEKAEEYCKRQNLIHWQEEIKRCEKRLKNLEADTIKIKHDTESELELAKLKLKKLEGV